jgi:hypothetical protein
MAFLALAVVMRGTFYILLAIFTIYTLFLVYHWFSYGTNVKVSMLALSVYLLGAAVLFLTMSALVI